VFGEPWVPSTAVNRLRCKMPQKTQERRAQARWLVEFSTPLTTINQT